MIAVSVAFLVAVGVFYLYTSLAFGWRGMTLGPTTSAKGLQRRQRNLDQWLTQAGLVDIDKREFVAVEAVIATLGGLLGYAMFGGLVAPIVLGVFAASFPLAAFRARREARIRRAQDAWPRMIEELRILTSSLGRSIPEALFDVGRRGPAELQPAFAAAHRDWLISTDFERAISVLKDRLADPTADATCETLLVAHELGGNDLDRRLVALAEDRMADVQGRKDAAAKQAGVKFARRFVLIVPFGMAVAGASVGNGRDAYSTPLGGLIVIIGVGLVIGCWVWAGRIMKLPTEDRVFTT